MPRFSVIMPVYNKAPYVVKAVESVLSQTCGDWELIVVDDGSKDGSSDLVKPYRDPRIRLHRQENAGVSVARNTGAAMAGGEYLCFLDADDWWEPAFLAEMSGLIDRHPDGGIYGTSYWIVVSLRSSTLESMSTWTNTSATMQLSSVTITFATMWSWT